MKCSWVSEKEQEHFRILPSVAMNQQILFDVLLESSDGQTFEANSELLAEKSPKFAAAFRFARMQTTYEFTSLKVAIPADGALCRLLLQHMYHGSLVTNLPKDTVACCDTLLDLAVLAEELICESLLQECEIRLLSANPRDCRCGICLGPKLLRDGRYWHINCGPPECVTTETAVDILAAADNLENFYTDASYSILVPSGHSSRSPLFFEFRPFQKLRNSVAVTCLTSGMNRVFQSSAFHSQVAQCSGDADIFKHFFLRYCLEELASPRTNPLLRSESDDLALLNASEFRAHENC